MSNYKKNPFSDLIDSYVNDTIFVPRNRYDTYFSVPGLSAEESSILASQREELSELLFAHKSFTSIPWDVLYKIKQLKDSIRSLEAKERAVVSTSGLREDILLKGDPDIAINEEEEELMAVYPDAPVEGEYEIGEMMSVFPNYNRLVKKIDKILFPNQQHETVDGYYLAFLPSGGKAIYIPMGNVLQETLTLNMWSQNPDMFNRYVCISPKFSMNMPVISEPINTVNALRVKNYPILPHLAYVEWNPRWYQDYLWVLSFHDPYPYDRENPRLHNYNTFDWRDYFKNRNPRW